VGAIAGMKAVRARVENIWQAIQAQWQQPMTQAIATILLGGLLVRGLIAAWLPPGYDEAYYYLYTRNWAWSYFDHPVMVALTTAVGPWLTGHVSALTIRLGPLVLYTGSLLSLGVVASQLFSRQVALYTIAIASLIPIFGVGFGVLTLPDSPLIFFWSVALAVAVREFFRAEGYTPSYRLAVLGLMVGLACLSKYHGLALGFGLVGFCLTSSRHRAALVSPWMVVAAGLFGLAIAPIILWNQQYDWISWRYQSGRAVPDRGYSVLELVGTVLIGIAYLFPSFGFPVWWVIGRSLGSQWGRSPTFLLATRNPALPEAQFPVAMRLILWLSLPLIVVFTVMGGYRPILPTWPMPGFWGTTILLGAAAAYWHGRSPKGVRRWLWGSGLVIGTVIAIALLHLNLGTLQQSSRFSWFGGVVPAKDDASVQLLGLGQIRQSFAQSPALQGALQRADFVFTSEIFMAGRVGMAIAPLSPVPVTTFSDDLRGFAFWSTADQWVGQTGLYLTDSRLAGIEPYQAYFATIEKVGEIPIQRGGAIVDLVQVYECRNLLKPYPRPYGR